MNCKNCGYLFFEGNACPRCGREEDLKKNIYYPMKWYKFLIYFLLWASVVFNILSAISSFSGDVYPVVYTKSGFPQFWQQEISIKVYDQFPVLKTLDVFNGFVSAALAVACVFVRDALNKCKANAPRFLVMMYISCAIMELIYIIPVMEMFEGMDEYFSIVVDRYRLQFDKKEVELALLGMPCLSFVGSIVMAIANHFYFQKRAHLFVN